MILAFSILSQVIEERHLTLLFNATHVAINFSRKEIYTVSIHVSFAYIVQLTIQPHVKLFYL